MTTIFAGLIDISMPSTILFFKNVAPVTINIGDPVNGNGAIGSPPTYNGCGFSGDASFRPLYPKGVACSSSVDTTMSSYQQGEYVPFIISGFVWVKTDGGDMNGQIHYDWDNKYFTTTSSATTIIFLGAKATSKTFSNVTHDFVRLKLSLYY